MQLGGRWTDEEKEIAYTTRFDPFIYGAFNVAITTGGITTANIKALGIPTRQSESKFTPRFALQHQQTKDVMLYVSATNGFKSGGWNARGGDPAAILPFGIEKVWSYEAGLKGDFLDNRLRVNANAFLFDVKNLQLVTGVTDPAGSTEPIFVTQNAGDLEVPGLEAELFADLAEGLGLFVSVGFMFSPEYSNLTDISGQLSEDTDPQRTPDITANIGLNYTLPVPALGGNLFFGVEYHYQDSSYTSHSNSMDSFQESYSTYSARAGWESEDGRWSVVAECKNCSDEVYLSSFFILPYYSIPERWNLGLRFKF
jgi:iron complex outermembrane receptor protein